MFLLILANTASSQADKPTITSPPDETYTNDTTPTIQGTGLAGATIAVKEGATTLGTTTIANDGTWSIDTSVLTEGSHILFAEIVPNPNGFVDAVLEFSDSGAGPMAGPYGGEFPGGAGFPIAVSLSVVLGDDPLVTKDFLSLPTGSFVTTLLSDEEMIDGAGDDLFIAEIGANGETADVYVSEETDNTGFVFLGTAIDNVSTSFDLASIGADNIRAIKIVGLDAFGGSPGFDVVNVQATNFSAIVPPPSDSITIHIDLTDPVAPVFTRPLNGDCSNDDAPTLVGTTEADATITVYVDAVLNGTSTADSSGNWTYDFPAALTSGLRVIAAEATDSAGNTGPQASITINVTDEVSKLYWADLLGNKIMRSNLDGSSIEDVWTSADGVTAPFGVAVDCASSQVYWTQRGSPSVRMVRRANTDGTGSIDNLVTGAGTLNNPSYIDLDISAGKMYWTDIGKNTVRRANLDGSTVEIIVDNGSAGVTDPLGLMLDLDNDKVYWSDYTIDKIQRANLDGSTVEDIITTGLLTPDDLAYDSLNAKVFWDDVSNTDINRANLDGTSAEDVVTGLTQPRGLVVVGRCSRVYWADSSAVKIQTANLDGTGITDLAVAADGLTAPRGLALRDTDTLSPLSPVITSPADLEVIRSEPFAVSGTAEVGSEVEVFIGASLVGTTTADGSGNWSLASVSGLTLGSNTLSASATDVSCNESSLGSNNITFTPRRRIIRID